MEEDSLKLGLPKADENKQDEHSRLPENNEDNEGLVFSENSSANNLIQLQ